MPGYSIKLEVEEGPYGPASDPADRRRGRQASANDLLDTPLASGRSYGGCSRGRRVLRRIFPDERKKPRHKGGLRDAEGTTPRQHATRRGHQIGCESARLGQTRVDEPAAR